MDPESLRAAFGRNGGRYLRHFERMQHAGRTWLPGWNFAAFLHSTGWFWYRRMYGWSLLNLTAPLLLLFALVFGVRWLVSGDGMGVALAATGVAYLLSVFVLLPLYADSLYLARLRREGKAPRPPSALTAIGALALIAIPGWMAYAAAAAQIEYQNRARVAEGLSVAASLRLPIAEFYEANRRLPGPDEAAQFRHLGALQHTASVGWDPARKAIVAVMGARLEGGRFEIAAQEKDGAIAWTCRPIDLAPEMLPFSCRPPAPNPR
ncbi:MAG TPA: pilin [Burkholderiales bacterium]|nr:pilin [Burkholderiales bacterium]